MYVTRAQIEAEIPRPHLIEALDDDRDGQEDEGLLDNVIANAVIAIHSPLSALYEVPFEDTVPTVVSEAAFIFVCESIYRRRQTPDEQNPYFKRAEDIRKRLNRIGRNEEKLESTIEKSFTNGAAITEDVSVDSTLR